MSIGDQNQELLLLQQKRRELEQQNFQLRSELSSLRKDLKFYFHREEGKDQNNECEKEQIKYVLTHSSIHIQKRQAEIIFLDQQKRLILQGQSDCQEINAGIKEFYTFSYSISLSDELEGNPKFVATDSKIEIIFDKNQKNNQQLIQIQ